ncbi:MAG: choice-of-anchor D domain-containing protein, partial [Planctomycetes bacterium]|nr:choice-of-anchor D domain-containing protein [Planctomycetota bacterium]
MLMPRKHPGIGNQDYASAKPLPHFEQLEPRILLSADGLLNVLGPCQSQNTFMDNSPEVVQCSELSQTHEQLEEVSQSDQSNTNDYQPILTLCVDDNANEKSTDEDLSISYIDSAQVNCDIAVLSNDTDGDIESFSTTKDGDMPFYINDTDLRAEYATSIEIRGPPVNETIALSGMHLVEPNVDNFDGQVVYLDFDGQDNVTYNGPVTIEGIYVPEFVTPGHFAGQEHAVITEVLGSLKRHFADSGVIFTTEKPEVGIYYSTIYIGGGDSVFTAYGSFMGLAEQIDVGNQDLCDEAFVFSDNLIGGHSTFETLTSDLVDIISHEVGHLLGYEHANSTLNGPLDHLAAFGGQQVISTQGVFPISVYACDLDGDGDSDVLSGSEIDNKIAWYENLGGGTFGSQQVISTQVNRLKSIYACDLDGDGDNDVLSASHIDDKIAWYENLGGGTFGGQQVISTQAGGALSVFAIDLDGDGDNDVLSASENDDKIAWYENLGNSTFGIQQVISSTANGAQSVFAIDLDGDGDNDILSASAYDDKIAWYENQGGGTFGSQQIITTQVNSARSVYACDLDGDGDNDVLSASNNDDEIAWYENLRSCTFGIQQILTTQADGARSVYACDLDGDGDNDVLSASYNDDKIAWYENLGGGTFSGQLIISRPWKASSVYACDLDGDGDNDVLSASQQDNKIAWYENMTWSPGGSPEIDVEQNGTDNVHTYSFGTLNPGQTVSQIFTVRNEGNAVLVVTQAAGLFSITPVNNSGTTDNWVIPANATQTFTVSFSPVDAGVYNNTLVLTNNDSDEGRYQISFTAVVSGPEFEVLGNNIVILDGDTTPDSTDHTDFGDMSMPSGSVTQLFTISNAGSEDLNLTGSPDRVIIIGSSDFTVTQQPASIIAASGTTTFEITFDPNSHDTITATVSIASNDYNEDPYDFAIRGRGVLFDNQQVISTQANGAQSVYAADLDGDGDNDVLSASFDDDKIAWYENLGNDTFGIEQVISTQVDGASSVYACDIDGDGDNDVLSASTWDDKIAWYENLGGGSFGTQQVISMLANGARSIYACDLDGDGDNDVLSASEFDNKIAWYENLGNSTFSTQQIIRTQANTPMSVYACDLDGDGDKDVLSAGGNIPYVAWYMNLGGGVFGSQRGINTWADGNSVYACDLDGDGDNDILSAHGYRDLISWNENLGGGTFSTSKDISTQANNAESVYACDLDGDGDNDVLSASVDDDKIAWYENFGGGNFGSQQIISTQANGAEWVYACDLDGDGDNDILSASAYDDKIAWHENLSLPIVGTPEIDVEVGGIDNIHSHSFGIVEVNQNVSQIFTVRNEGTVDLTVTQASGLTNPFSINPVNVSGIADDWVIPAGGTQTFTVSFSPLYASSYNDTLVLTSNDSDESSYQINFTAAATGPDIEVLGNGQVIVDGDTIPSLNDNTDFGGVNVLSGSLSQTFTIRNTGLLDLNLTGTPDRVVITGSSDFTVTQQPVSLVVASGGTTTFEITFDPSDYVIRTATVSIACNDYDEDPYDFIIQGQGTDWLFGGQQVITTQANGANSVFACDLDGDGDNDIISASYYDNKIAWYENLGNSIFSGEKIINTQVNPGVSSVFACDLDGDGDNDVLSGYWSQGKVAWCENQGNGTFGSQQVISTQVGMVWLIYACDLDGDGDNDVLSASENNEIAWYENLGNGLFGSKQVISIDTDEAHSVYACDLDGDGDNDVLSASKYDNKIAWYENLGGGLFGNQQVISTQANWAMSVYACDLDGDGDNDILSASEADDKIAWYENLGGGAFGSQQVITTDADLVKSVYSCDLDGDGDNDILSACNGNSMIAWYENLGGGTFGGQQVISTLANGAYSVYACDLDGDGDNDVLSASSNDRKIAWYENLRSPGAGTPEIDIEINGTDDVHAYSFGNLQVGQNISQQFTIRNEGTVDLTVTQASGLANPFTINPVNNSGSADNWIIPAAGVRTFNISFSPVDAGSYNDTLMLISNDSDEGSYQISFTAVALGPEIEVMGNSQIIADGDTTPDTIDHTDFGSISISSGSVTRTFTIMNVGSEDLNLTGSPDRVVVTGGADFTITQQPTSSVASGGMTTFEVTFSPSSAGTKTATISIISNDYNENPYDFVLQGKGWLFGNQQIISTVADEAFSVYACDLDGDGDNDVLSASLNDDKIAWYENLGGGTFSTQQVITTQTDGAHSVYACDLDGDGDNDVLSASYYDDKIAWYENLGGGNFASQQVISTQANGPRSVYACDLDGDGDNDILSASYDDNKIAWYENLGGGTFGSQQVISTQVTRGWAVYACDLDDDGDNDVLSASVLDNKIAWYENLGNGTFGIQQVISTQAAYARSVYACDLDGDGDNDVLSASYNDNKIAWYENLGGGSFGSQQVISNQASQALSVYASDLDGDGDKDVLSASAYDDKIAWYDNLGGGTFGSQQIISTQADFARSVYACDLDGDGDNDVLSASDNDDKIAWYENLGPTSSGPQILLSEDFNDGDYNGWTLVEQGTRFAPMQWSAATGVMIQSSNIVSAPPHLVAKLGTFAYW